MPSGGYSAGSAFLEIVPSFRGIAQKIDAEMRRLGVSAGNAFSGTFNDAVKSKTKDTEAGPSSAKSGRDGSSSGDAFGKAFKTRVEAALAALPDANIGADASEADAEIEGIRARLVSLRDARIGIDIDESAARAEIAALQADLDQLARKSPSVAVKIDAAAAFAKLAALKAEMDAVDRSRISVAVESSGITGASAGISGMSLAVAGLLPMLGPLAAGLAAVGAGAAAAVGAAGAGIGVAALGISGISDVSKLLDARQKAAAAAAKAPAGSPEGAAAAAQLATIDAQLAKVNPATLQFAEFINGKLKPAFTGLKVAAAAGIAPGLQAGFDSLMSHMPELSKFVSDLSKTVGDLFAQFAESLNDPAFRKFFSYIEESAGPILGQLAAILTNLGKAFANFMVAMAPVTSAIGDALVGLSSKLANTDAFQRFADWLMTNGAAIASAIGNVVKLIGTLVTSLAPLGVIVMQAIGWFAGLISSLPPDVILAIAAAILGMVVAVKALGIAAAIATGMNPLVLVIGLIAAAVTTAAVLIVKNWDAIKNAFLTVWNWLKDVFLAGWTIAVNAISTAFTAVKNALTTTWNGIKTAATTVWDAIKLVIVTPVQNAITAITTAVGAIGRAMSTAWNGVKSVARTAWNLIHDYIVNPLQTAYNWVKNTFSSIGSAISGAFNNVVDFIKTPINAVIRSINWVIHQLNKLSFTVPDWVPVIGGNHFGFDIGDIPELATGTSYFAGGTALVGERGPELVNLPTGSQVIPASRTAAMLSGRAAEISVFLDSRIIGRAVAPVIADEVRVYAGALR